MQTIVEMPEFIRCAKKLGLSEGEREDIIRDLASNPNAGDEISGTGGMRKLRVAPKGKGKSGGYRIVTFYSCNSNIHGFCCPLNTWCENILFIFAPGLHCGFFSKP